MLARKQMDAESRSTFSREYFHLKPLATLQVKAELLLRVASRIKTIPVVEVDAENIHIVFSDIVLLKATPTPLDEDVANVAALGRLQEVLLAQTPLDPISVVLEKRLVRGSRFSIATKVATGVADHVEDFRSSCLSMLFAESWLAAIGVRYQQMDTLSLRSYAG